MAARSKKRARKLRENSRGLIESKWTLSRLGILVAGVVIVLAGLLAYCNSLGGPFIFDDEVSIIENSTIRQLFSIGEVLSPPEGGQAVQRRPIVNLSLAINYWLGGLEVTGYHIFNISVHILAALTLFAVVRRTLRVPLVPESIKDSSAALGLVIALIWVVHPLQTEAVSYVIQRTELLAGLFYLLTLYCVIRGSGSSRSVFWYVTGVIACTLGMGSKETMVSAPLVIPLYDRVFLCGSFKEVFRRRWGLYVGLAATWGVLVALIPHGHEGTAVFGRESSSVDYALTQFEAISNYLRLCFWPRPLILDYGTYALTSFQQVLPYAIFIALLVVGTVLSLRYRPWLGFLGVWFFAILAPSSSFVPLLGQPSAEKRMYLPLAAVIAMVVVCAYSLGVRFLGRLGILSGWRRVLGYSLAGSVVVVLGLLSVNRNSQYQTALSIWNDSVLKRPGNWRAYASRGAAYGKLGKYDEAIADLGQAIKLNSEDGHQYNGRGGFLLIKGEYDLAILDFDQAIKLVPSYAKPYNNRGLAYLNKGVGGLAMRNFNWAIERDPKYVKAYNNRGLAYAMQGEYERAIGDFSTAIGLDPQFGLAHRNRGQAYMRMGKYVEAGRDFDQAIQLNPSDAIARRNRNQVLMKLGRGK